MVVQTSPVPFDIIGFPEIAFPIGFGTSSTRPAARQSRSARSSAACRIRDRLLALAAAYQAVTDFHTRRPPDPDARGACRGTSSATVDELRLTAEDAEVLSSEDGTGAADGRSAAPRGG